MATLTRGFAEFQSVLSGGDADWQDPENAGLSDNVRASAVLLVDLNSALLVATGVPAGAASVPDDATLSAISIQVECHAVAIVPGDVFAFIVELYLVSGTTLGENCAVAPGVQILVGPAKEAYRTIDCWSSLPAELRTPAVVNAADFGVRVRAQVQSPGVAGTVYIDHVRVTFQYEEGPEVQIYKIICDRLIEVLNAERTGALSQDVESGPVTAVSKGEYVPNESSAKPIVYVRPELPALIADMAGNMKRVERMVHRITCAVIADTQAEAMDDACNLMNNIENILMHYGKDTYWAGGHLGFRYGTDENPEEIGGLFPDHGTENCVVHFRLWWSCNFGIDREAI